MIARTFYQGYFIHSLSTLHYCNALGLATRLTGNYRDRTYTGKCGPALLDTPNKKDLIEDYFLYKVILNSLFILLFFTFSEYLKVPANSIVPLI